MPEPARFGGPRHCRPPGPGSRAKHVRLYPSRDRADRIYVSFDERLMAYRLADGAAALGQAGRR